MLRLATAATAGGIFTRGAGPLCPCPWTEFSHDKYPIVPLHVEHVPNLGCVVLCPDTSTARAVFFCPLVLGFVVETRFICPYSFATRGTTNRQLEGGRFDNSFQVLSVSQHDRFAFPLPPRGEGIGVVILKR